MTNILKNTALGTWALIWTEYLSDWLVGTAIEKTTGVVNNILSNVWPAPQLTAFAWVAAPFALGWYAAYKWIKEEWIYNWVERGLLTYGIGWVAAGLTWVLSIPLAPQILAAWAWMYWIKKIASAISQSVSVVKDSHPIDYMVGWIANMPGKAWNWLKSMTGFGRWSSTASS